MKVSLLYKSICGALGVAIFTGYGLNAFAQEDDNQSAVMEEVVVTGSRIPQNPNLSSASPVLAVDSDEFRYSGITRVEDLLNDLPQVTGSNSSNDSNGATGTATINLRDLGAARTLTLMNGRRLPTGSPVQGASGADVNFIPSALVERVEIVTGGGSATYGTDAIAGVVNFIMKDNLEGLLVDFQGSTYQHTNDSSTARNLLDEAGIDAPSRNVFDGESFTLSLAYGANLFEQGNVTGYLTYRDTEAIQQSERDYSACAYGGRVADGSRSCVGSGTIAEGRFVTSEPGSGVDVKLQGDQFVPTDGTTFNFAPTNYFQRPDERITAGYFAHFDFSDSLTLYSEFGYMNTQTLTQLAPSGSFFNEADIRCDNPLLSDQQRQTLCGDFGLAGTDVQPTLVAKRSVEGGSRANDIELEQTRFVIGLQGQFTDSWGFDVSANFGRVDLETEFLNDLSITSIGRALDVVPDENGNAVCQSALDGTDPNCVPWNLYQEGGVTQEALDYLGLSLTQDGSTETTNVIAYVTGDMTSAGWVIPGADQGVQLVFGLEYRDDTLKFNPDENFQSGDGAGQGGPTPAVSGGVEASEAFTEAKIPFSEYVNLGFGYRYSDYDTDQETDALKVTFDWQVNESLLLRASFQDASRHANVRELFRPQGIGLFSGAESTDPCDGTPTATLEECARSGVTAAQFGNILENPAGQYNEIQGGNELLEPEESETFSAGFVFTPADLPGLNLTVDWYNIDLENAIGTSGSLFTINSCIFDGEFCDRINRGSNGSLWIGDANVVNTNANLGFEERAGVDVAFNYAGDAGRYGSYRANFVMTIVTKYDTQNVPGGEITDCNGLFNGLCSQPNPKYRHNARLSWDHNDVLTTSYAWRRSGNVDEDTTDDVGESFRAQNYFDVSALLNVGESTTLRLGINNVFDRTPPTSGSSGAFTNGNVEVTEYDVLGRYLFVGVSYQL